MYSFNEDVRIRQNAQKIYERYETLKIIWNDLEEVFKDIKNVDFWIYSTYNKLIQFKTDALKIDRKTIRRLGIRIKPIVSIEKPVIPMDQIEKRYIGASFNQPQPRTERYEDIYKGIHGWCYVFTYFNRKNKRNIDDFLKWMDQFWFPKNENEFTESVPPFTTIEENEICDYCKDPCNIHIVCDICKGFYACRDCFISDVWKRTDGLEKSFIMCTRCRNPVTLLSAMKIHES